MKKHLFLFTLLFGTICSVSSCSNDDDQPAAPVISTEQEQQLPVPFTGGDYTITYAVSTAVRPYVDSDSDWARIVSSNATTTHITVDAHEGEARTAKIVVSYDDAQPLIFTVSQAGKPAFNERLKVTAEPECDSFKIIVENLEGKDLWYYYMALTKEYYDEHIAADPSAWVIENARQKYNAWHNYFMTWGGTVTSFVNYYALTNDAKNETVFEQFNDGSRVRPDTEYVAIAYDLDPDGNCKGNYSTCVFRTKELPPVETVDVTFDLQISYNPQDTRYPFRIDVTPSIADCYFFYYIAPEADYQQALAALGGGDPDKMTAEIYKQLDELGELYKYRYSGQYYQTWNFPAGSDGKVSLRAIACGLDPYDRINSKVTVSERYTFTVTPN